jgi:hypothetical protein
MEKLSIFYYSIFTTITPPSKLSFTPHKRMNIPRLFAMKVITRGTFNISVLNNKQVRNTKSMTSVAKKCKYNTKY